ncbi:lanthionine synthetase LanC family protein [Streptomyces sp. NPDC020412]|uniref:lanthionine synthetase LanC family protein n=1 Tax=Streptomyces sp. NPDC020412 TaxID=3365073 RepID=UPI0037940762
MAPTVQHPYALDPHPLDLAVEYLDGFRAVPESFADAGVPVLARLVAETGGSRAVAAAQRSVAQWTRTVGRGPAHHGLYDVGLTGTLVGLDHAALLHPPLQRVADGLRDRLVDAAERRPWRTESVAFRDYDLISGPAGTLLALSAGTSDTAPLLPFAQHLAALCDDADLPRLRTSYAEHPTLSWLHGRINTGMGHGVAGVATALTAAVRRLGPEPHLTGALHHTVRWLTRQSFDDDRGIRSWDGAGLDGRPQTGARPRQAWCYGNPGVAWAVWDGARTLDDQESAEWALDAFTTFADGFDEDFHLFGAEPTDLLGLCHGAAGVLAVTDAFARHARLPVAVLLRTRLLHLLERRLSDTSAWAELHPGLLGGATGVLSALLTAAHDGDRGWLPCLGLR